MDKSLAHTILQAGICGCVGLAAAASPAAASPFSATRTVIAIVDGELFLGEAIGHLDGAGTIAIQSQKDPAVTCLGEFTSSAKLGGNGNLRCTDGATAIFHFERLTTFHGHGTGTSSRGEMSFTYGLTAEEAAPFLKLPGGKKFSPAGSALTLVDL